MSHFPGVHSQWSLACVPDSDQRTSESFRFDKFGVRLFAPATVASCQTGPAAKIKSNDFYSLSDGCLCPVPSLSENTRSRFKPVQSSKVTAAVSQSNAACNDAAAMLPSFTDYFHTATSFGIVCAPHAFLCNFQVSETLTSTVSQVPIGPWHPLGWVFKDHSI